MRQLMLIAGSVLALATATPALAQTPTVPAGGCTQPYYVQEGDTLWALAQLKWQQPDLWRWLVKQNPMLGEAGRYRQAKDGREIVLIRPNEPLYCLEEAGVNLSNGTVTLNQNVLPTVVAGADDGFTNSDLGEFAKDWWWLVLLLAGGAFATWLLWQLRRDPVESGQPQVQGGVDDTTAHEAFVSRAWVAGGFNIVPGSMVLGRGYGPMMVSYQGGKARPRRLNGDLVYRATVQHHRDRRQEVMYMLQGCGNDVTYGGFRYLPGADFRFVADQPLATPVAEEPAPEAAEEPTEVAPTAPPAVVEEALVEATPTPAPEASEPELKIEFKPAETAEGTAMVRVKGAPTEDMVLTIGTDGFTLRFHPPKKPV